MKNLKFEKPFENWNMMDYFKIKDDEMKRGGTWSPRLHVKSDHATHARVGLRVRVLELGIR